MKPDRHGEAWQYYAGTETEWVFGATYDREMAIKTARDLLASAGYPDAPIDEKRPFGKWAK